MYDFNRFIDLLNKKVNTLDYAIDLVKEPFHIGKIVVEARDFSMPLVSIKSESISEKPIVVYSNENSVISFYSNKDGYSYTNEDIFDINLLLRLISLSIHTFVLTNKVREAEHLSYNTKLFNSHGYISKLVSMADTIDGRDYNSYYINLKGFGLINKLYGTDLANEAIIRYSQELKAFALDDEVVGHLGGDNFVAFIKRSRAEEFVNMISKVKVFVGRGKRKLEINLTSTIGYDEIKVKKIDYSSIISNPAMACQYARNTKKPVVKLTDELVEMVNSIKNIESTFDDEMQKGNFVVYYQPKFDILSGKIIGVEALSRWINNGQLVPPGMFVPILEKNGEIVRLDLFVLENLCKDIHNYRNMGHNIVPASCNLSRRDFEIEDLEKRVIDIIKKYNVKTEDIVIEVTETTNLEENERLAKFIDTMNQNGILTSVDDFGTGYSSLSVLRDFKVSEIKIDRSFINRDILDASDEIIIGSIINMANRLNISVICEGVENEKQAKFLVNLGCNKAQGYLYSKPVPKLEFEAMLQRIGTYHDEN
ncbi:MAG: GGDEF domain-containing phosphodiesterase [Acholeplasmatales bacterium]|nr:GGDEF domain-containing phosphodiesterase [Acholeplasmatales bacterium]